jgi:hypothetical protein
MLFNVYGSRYYFWYESKDEMKEDINDFKTLYESNFVIESMIEIDSYREIRIEDLEGEINY